jgi:voltage-gated potassium channel
MYDHLQRRTQDLLELNSGGRLGRVIDLGIMSLIVLSVAGVIMGTVDWFRTSYQSLLFGLEMVSVGVFTVEYVGRVWSAPAAKDFDRPVVGRLRYMLQPYLIIDLLAILPFYLGAVLLDLRFLRALRLFRFFRILKLARYSNTMQQFGHVIRDKKEDFVITFAATGILLVVASSLMFFVEHEAQPDAFASIPAAMWWGVVTLTTVGYGGVTPVTALGRVLNALIAMLGIGLFALPASILASGFIEDETDVDSHSEYDYCPHCGEEL